MCLKQCFFCFVVAEKKRKTVIMLIIITCFFFNLTIIIKKTTNPIDNQITRLVRKWSTWWWPFDDDPSNLQQIFEKKNVPIEILWNITCAQQVFFHSNSNWINQKIQKIQKFKNWSLEWWKKVGFSLGENSNFKLN